VTVSDPIQIKTVAQLRMVLASGSGLVITDPANKRVFHSNPESCSHIQEHSFVTKVIENQEKNGSYFAVATLDEARREWPQIQACQSSSCSVSLPKKPATGHEAGLCRGWTTSNVREAMTRASEPQLEVLATIARHPNITTAEIAEELGLESYRNVRALLARFSSATAPIGVLDPKTGKPSWPFEHRKPAAGSNFERYYMPPEVAEVVLGQPRIS
jgi:hypothetical protein